MNYTQLNNTYKYDTLAENIYSREVEYFHYDFDKKNFEEILKTAEGLYRADIEQRLNDTITQMTIVENIYNALLAQVDDQTAYAAAVARAVAKRTA
jgi:hypothetical protein